MHLPAELAAAAGYYGDHWGSLTEVPVEGAVPPVHLSFPRPYEAPAVQGVDPPAWAPKPAPASAAGATEVLGTALGAAAFVALVVAGAFFTFRRGFPALKGAFGLRNAEPRPGAVVPAFFPASASVWPQPTSPPDAPVVRSHQTVVEPPPVPAPEAQYQRGPGPSAEQVEGKGTTPLVPVPAGPTAPARRGAGSALPRPRRARRPA